MIPLLKNKNKEIFLFCQYALDGPLGMHMILLAFVLLGFLAQGQPGVAGGEALGNNSGIAL